MGAARDLYLRARLAVPGNEDAYETLCRAAGLWRAEERPFSAGMAMLRAVESILQDRFSRAIDWSTLIHSDHDHVRREAHFG